MPKTALVLLIDGFEEIEAITPIDLLRRAEVDVCLASVTDSLELTGRNGIKLVADRLLSELESTETNLLLLPGGPGTFALRERADVLDLIRARHAAGTHVAAICAAPLLLKDAGLLGEDYTAHHSTLEELPKASQTAEVMTDGSLTTSAGAGTALAFGLHLVELLQGKACAEEVAQSICHRA